MNTNTTNSNWNSPENTLTVEKLKDSMRKMNDVFDRTKASVNAFGFSMNQLFGAFNMKVFEDVNMTETEEYEEIITLSLKERWLTPISTWDNFISMPWEPWIKTRKVIKIRQVPSRKAIQTQMGLIMHPILHKELFSITNIVS